MCPMVQHVSEDVQDPVVVNQRSVILTVIEVLSSLRPPKQYSRLSAMQSFPSVGAHMPLLH